MRITNAFWVNTAVNVMNKHYNNMYYNITHCSLVQAPMVSALWTGDPLYYLWCIGQWISLWRSVQCEKELCRCMWMRIDVKLCTNTSNILLSELCRWPARWEEGSRLGTLNLDALQTASWYSPVWLNLRQNQWKIPSGSCTVLISFQTWTL